MTQLHESVYLPVDIRLLERRDHSRQVGHLVFHSPHSLLAATDVAFLAAAGRAWFDTQVGR